METPVYIEGVWLARCPRCLSRNTLQACWLKKDPSPRFVATALLDSGPRRIRVIH